MFTKEQKKQWSTDKASELKSRLDGFLSETLIDKDKIKTLVDHYRINGLYHYSLGNSIMILMQGGTTCQSFNTWQDLGRNVKKGEKSHIYISMPVFAKKENPDDDDERRKLIYFMMRPVFDITQTEGKPLEYNHNSEENKTLEFADVVTDLKGLVNCPIVTEITGEARGYCSTDKIAISEMSNNIDKVKTLFHETAHYLFKHNDNSEKDKNVREIEAETVAALIFAFYGIEYELSSEYIQWYKTKQKIDKNGILRITEKIIKHLTAKPEEQTAAIAA